MRQLELEQKIKGNISIWSLPLRTGLCYRLCEKLYIIYTYLAETLSSTLVIGNDEAPNVAIFKEYPETARKLKIQI